VPREASWSLMPRQVCGRAVAACPRTGKRPSRSHRAGDERHIAERGPAALFPRAAAGVLGVTVQELHRHLPSRDARDAVPIAKAYGDLPTHECLHVALPTIVFVRSCNSLSREVSITIVIASN
jgi:hypothetical protein